jgi:hypothetical protein
VEELSIWLTVIGFPLALGGLWLTWQQVRATQRQASRLATAAEAANQAAERTARSLANNHILVLVPDLERMSADLIASVRDTDADGAIDGLQRWRAIGIRVRGLLHARGDVPEELFTLIAKSLTAATTATGRLQNGEDPTDATRAAIKAIARVNDALGDIGAQILGQPNSGGTNEQG